MSQEMLEVYRNSLRMWTNHPDFPGWIDFQAHISLALQNTGDKFLKHVEPNPSVLHALLMAFLVALIGCSALFSMVHNIFDILWPAFENISPPHKKMYVVANLCKSLVLCLQCCSISWLWYSYKEYACTINLLGFDNKCDWNVDAGHQYAVKMVCITYVITDVVALLVVPKLPFSTKLHHYATSAFLTWIMFIDISQSPIAQKLMLYGFWSTLAFPVNAFLALRVMFETSAWLSLVAKLSFVVYAVCCFANWSLHLLWLIECILGGGLSQVEWACTLGYLAAITALVHDDLKLMNWLRTFDPKNPRGQGKSGQGEGTEKPKAA